MYTFFFYEDVQVHAFIGVLASYLGMRCVDKQTSKTF